MKAIIPGTLLVSHESLEGGLGLYIFQEEFK
jgi:hypothetical protein